MMREYPQFKNPELGGLVEKLNVIEKDIHDRHTTLEDLRKERDSLYNKLQENTYEWLIHYEVQIKDSEGKFKGSESWANHSDVCIINGDILPYYHSQFVETEEEVMVKIMQGRREIINLVGKEVEYKGLLSKYKGIITDYNIEWVQITKGRFQGPDKQNIVYEENRPPKRPMGGDD